MQPGVLVISHGSREADWVKLVDDAAAAVAASETCASMGPGGGAVPVVSAFLEIVEGRLIQDGIDRLTAEGVNELYVLPLFVSSGSTHADDIAQAFGAAPASPARAGELERFRVPAGVRVHMGLPIDDDGEGADGRGGGEGKGDGGEHGSDGERLGAGDVSGEREYGGGELGGRGGDVSESAAGEQDGRGGGEGKSDGGIAGLLLANIAPLSMEPARERVLLVAHGSREAVFHGRWRDGMTRLARRLRALGGFAGADIAMLLPDQAACKLRALRKRYPDDAFIVVPLFLSEGYFTRTVIPKRLAGLAYRYNGRALLPNPRIANWMERQIFKWLATMDADGVSRLGS